MDGRCLNNLRKKSRSHIKFILLLFFVKLCGGSDHFFEIKIKSFWIFAGAAPVQRDQDSRGPPGPPGGKSGTPWMQGFEPPQPNLPWPANNSRNEGGPPAPSGVGKGNLERSTSYHSDRGSGRDRVIFFQILHSIR